MQTKLEDHLPFHWFHQTQQSPLSKEKTKQQHVGPAKQRDVPQPWQRKGSLQPRWSAAEAFQGATINRGQSRQR